MVYITITSYNIFIVIKEHVMLLSPKIVLLKHIESVQMSLIFSQFNQIKKILFLQNFQIEKFLPKKKQKAANNMRKNYI